jgi:hypothetical protein
MEYSTIDKIYGVTEGVSYGQHERVDELNTRISSRQFSDQPLQPNYNPRPVPTKYALFPTINRRKEVKEMLMVYPEYNTYNNFNPGTAKAPPSGFINNVDTETILRNQAFALQKADQNVYVPSSHSDLYKVEVVSRPSEQPYPLLFNRFQFDDFQHPNNVNKNIGKDVFSNHTRTQLRGGH